MLDKIPSRQVMAQTEITENPIFLFQYKNYFLRAIPIGCDIDEDGEIFRKPVGNDCDLKEREYLSWEELESQGSAISYWITETVFYSREEAQEYGRAKQHSYPHGWKVYCVPCKGVLAPLLKDNGDKFLNQYRGTE